MIGHNETSKFSQSQRECQPRKSDVSHLLRTKSSFLIVNATNSIANSTAMIALWRLLLAALTVVAAFLLVRPATEMLLAAIRSRMDKRFRYDCSHHSNQSRRRT